MSGEPAIATVGLTKDYGSGHGLFGLDLEVHRGEVFVLTAAAMIGCGRRDLVA